MNKKTTPLHCKLPWCNKPYYAMELCRTHYRRSIRNDNQPLTGEETLIVNYYVAHVAELAQQIHEVNHVGNFNDCKLCKEITNDPQSKTSN